jgi:hypothetical protein
MGFQPMNPRQDADATRLHGQDARATSQIGAPVVSLYFSRSRFSSVVNSLTVSA